MDQWRDFACSLRNSLNTLVTWAVWPEDGEVDGSWEKEKGTHNTMPLYLQPDQQRRWWQQTFIYAATLVRLVQRGSVLHSLEKKKKLQFFLSNLAFVLFFLYFLGGVFWHFFPLFFWQIIFLFFWVTFFQNHRDTSNYLSCGWRSQAHRDSCCTLMPVEHAISVQLILEKHCYVCVPA